MRSPAGTLTIYRILERQGKARRLLSEEGATVAGSQAIGRALAVLGCFIHDGTDELGITEIARALDLTPSTVHRLVRALAAGGLLEQNEQTSRYYLGRTAIVLGQVAQRNYRVDAVLPHLERLSEATGESVNFVLRDGGEGIVTLHIASNQVLKFDQPPGTHVPLHSSASGKAMLAFSPDPDADVNSLAALHALTAHTITDKKKLKGDLRAIRKRGYSIDDEEYAEGVRCVGAPVLDVDGCARAAVAVQAPAVRMPLKRLHEVAPAVRAAAADIAGLIPPDRRI
jgi:IclR family transcriptional regulator, acetate operon repressor